MESKKEQPRKRKPSQPRSPEAKSLDLLSHHGRLLLQVSLLTTLEFACVSTIFIAHRLLDSHLDKMPMSGTKVFMLSISYLLFLATFATLTFINIAQIREVRLVLAAKPKAARRSEKARGEKIARHPRSLTRLLKELSRLGSSSKAQPTAWRRQYRGPTSRSRRGYAAPRCRPGVGRPRGRQRRRLRS